MMYLLPNYITGKVALITGGASGLGLEYAKELLRNGLKAVTLADLNADVAKMAIEQLEREFGSNKAIFVKTDVTNYQEFENAFRLTIEKFSNIDILINNAGVFNDATWEREIAVNVNGSVHGMLLGLEKYLPKYKQGSEAVIINISSVAGLQGFGGFPVYSSTKFSIIGMTIAWGIPYHYERTKVRVVAICPGKTLTPLLTGIMDKHLGKAYEQCVELIGGFPAQQPEHVSKEAVKVIKTAKSGTLWVVEGGQPAYEFIFPRLREYNFKL